MDKSQATSRLTECEWVSLEGWSAPDDWDKLTIVGGLGFGSCPNCNRIHAQVWNDHKALSCIGAMDLDTAKILVRSMVRAIDELEARGINDTCQ